MRYRRSSETSCPIRSLLAAGILASSLAGNLGCSDLANDGEPGRILVSGHMEATEVRISTKIGGTLKWFPVEEGNRVEQGQKIAQIDTVDLELNLAAVRAESDLARAELELRRSGYRAEEIAEARAQVDAAEAELAAAERDLERFQGLLDSGSGTEKLRDDARTRREVAANMLQAARERLRKLESGFRREETEAARARFEAARARIAQIEQQIGDAAVVSPVAGVVTEKLAEAGELLAPGSGLAMVTQLDDAWLTAYLPEPDLGKVRLGQQAIVETDGGETRRGELTFINAQAEFTPRNVQTRDERIKLVYRIKISVDNRDGLFKPGMPAHAWLEPQSSSG
ncbi:MAG: efflux RND transporter periplasmic adaptor subunit [Acidobacteriota bacterium]|nr:MAG: efflux RND transporter periplasmic adaptor subunit [Acidobacteriota bacterium]